MVSLDGNEKIIRSEKFFSDEFIREKGIERVTLSYDANEKEKTAEYSYADRAAGEKGLDVMIIHFDDKGNEVKTEYFRNKRLIQTVIPQEGSGEGK